MALLTSGRVLTALLLAAGAASCFSPRQPDCAFSCAADGLCPSGYQCGAEGICHREDYQGTCDISSQVDAGTPADGADATSPDADGG